MLNDLAAWVRWIYIYGFLGFRPIQNSIQTLARADKVHLFHLPKAGNGRKLLSLRLALIHIDALSLEKLSCAVFSSISP